MKIVISTDGDFVSAHFGRCPNFTIVDIKDGKVFSKELIDNPGHQPGYLPQFFHQKKVDAIIAGGMGESAKNLFNQFGIKQYVGVSGRIEDVIKQFLEGTLINGESFCSHGEDKGYEHNDRSCGHEKHYHSCGG